MNDRLEDLPEWAAYDEETLEDDEGPATSGKKSDGGDIEMGDTNKHKEHFFREVESIEDDIEAIRKATRLIGEYDEAALKATATEEENEISRKLRPLIDDTNKRAKRIKTLLGLLKEESKKLLDDGKMKQSDLRIHENLCNTLTRKFMDEMKSYQNAQQKYKSDIKKKVARQVQNVKPDATEDEIDAVMRSEGGIDALYRELVLIGGINDQVKTTCTKVAGKYQDVLALEQSVADLQQMLLDFAFLTEQQGEQLDQIEFQVKQAGDYVEDGNVNIYKSIEYQKKIRKKQCWILLIVVVVAALLILAIMFS